MDVAPEDPLELLEIRAAVIGFASFVQDAVGIRHGAESRGCKCRCVFPVRTVSTSPSQLCQATEYDSLVVGEYRRTIVSAAVRKVEAVVDQVLGVDHPGGVEPVPCFDGFVVVVASGWVVGSAVG